MPRAQPDKRLNKWLMVSAGLHVALLAIGALFSLARSIPEPQEQGIAVELVAPGPAQMARADTPSPVPAQTSTPNPAPPTPEPPAPEPPRNAPPAAGCTANSTGATPSGSTGARRAGCA